MPPLPRIPRSTGLVYAGAAQGRREEGQLMRSPWATHLDMAPRWAPDEGALSAAEPQPATSAPRARPQGVAASPGASAALSALTEGAPASGLKGCRTDDPDTSNPAPSVSASLDASTAPPGGSPGPLPVESSGGDSPE